MELYSRAALASSKRIIALYSTSFAMSAAVLARPQREAIAAVYALVRIADEVVDTYSGPDAATLLDALERDVTAALERTYSTNPVVQAFVDVARRVGIDEILIAPFFASMRMDIEQKVYTPELYSRYIYGSAEVIGLMCLKIFLMNEPAERYAHLAHGAQALGAAYQKVNFLRDLADDATRLGRLYFPGVQLNTFTDETRDVLVAEIKRDLDVAAVALKRLPRRSRVAVEVSVRYYGALLRKIARTPAAQLLTRRVRVANAWKVWLLVQVSVQQFLWRQHG